MHFDIGSVFGDAWSVYRLLFRRSVTSAAIVFGLIGLADIAGDTAENSFARFALGLTTFVVDLAGPVLVQGALIEIVRNIHEGRRPERIGNLFSRAQRRFWSLLWASLVYGFGIIFGLILLIVPGLLAAARWCLMAPLIMLNGADAGSARARSSALVTGRTWPVLQIILVLYVLFGLPVLLANLFLPGGLVVFYLLRFFWSAFTAPFDAHVLTVLYYRMTDPERPVVHQDVFRWSSVWSGPSSSEGAG